MPLETIQRGRQNKPPRILCYGTEGIGKSTWASQAPAPIFLPTEDGLDQIECDRFPLIRDYATAVQCLVDLYTEEHPYQTVVIDSLDWLETLVWDQVCARFHATSIERVDKGFGKGYVHALQEWRELLSGLDALRDERHMAVILLAHSQVEKFDDPATCRYDRYSPRLNRHAAALLVEWTDAVLFASRRFRTEVEDVGFNRERTIAIEVGPDGGERILRTTGGPVCVAKNRYNMPTELTLSWAAVESALQGS